MRKEFLANAIANIGDEYVEEFARVKKRKTIRNVFTGIGAVGAAAALALVIGLNANKPFKDPYSDLPKVSTADYASHPWGVNGSGYGWITKGVPTLWNESMMLETMPVYMSESTEPNHEKMLNYIKNAAAALGISEKELVIDDRYDQIKEEEEEDLANYEPSEEYPTFDSLRRWLWSEYSIVATAGDIELRLSTDYTLMVTFGLMPKDGIELPSEYNFSIDAPAAEHEKALNYLAERFKALTGYEDHKVSLKRNYMISLAPDGSDASIITNTCLDKTFFSVVEEDGCHMLCSILVYSPAGLNKLGDYPILSVDEAKKELRSDRFSGEDRMPEDAEILQIEMTYVNWKGFTAVMPYYEFYVRSDETAFFEDGTVCKLYRIPAIPSSFLEDVETDDYGTRAAN